MPTIITTEMVSILQTQQGSIFTSVFQQVKNRSQHLWGRLRSNAPVQPAQPLGLAFGSGGLRGGAHIGVLEVLEEAGIEPQLVAGTSAGSLIAVLKGMGWNSQQLREATTQLSPGLFTDLSVHRLHLLTVSARALLEYLQARPKKEHPTQGIIKGLKYEAWLEQLIGKKSFDDLQIPTYVVATDLATGEAVVYGPTYPAPSLPPGFRYVTGVDVVQAIRASSAIPMIFEPVRIGNSWLIDGAFSEPVPASILRWAHAKTVIAVDLGMFSAHVDPDITHCNLDQFNLFDVLGRATSIITDRHGCQRLEGVADIIIRPGIRSVKLTNVEAVESFIASGREAATHALHNTPKAKQRSSA